MIPARYAHVLFSLFLSGFMSLLVSRIATLKNAGLTADILSLWMGAWLSSWLLAFPAVLVIAPLVRRLVARLTVAEDRPA